MSTFGKMISEPSSGNNESYLMNQISIENTCIAIENACDLNVVSEGAVSDIWNWVIDKLIALWNALMSFLNWVKNKFMGLFGGVKQRAKVNLQQELKATQIEIAKVKSMPDDPPTAKPVQVKVKDPGTGTEKVVPMPPKEAKLEKLEQHAEKVGRSLKAIDCREKKIITISGPDFSSSSYKQSFNNFKDLASKMLNKLKELSASHEYYYDYPDSDYINITVNNFKENCLSSTYHDLAIYNSEQEFQYVEELFRDLHSVQNIIHDIEQFKQPHVSDENDAAIGIVQKLILTDVVKPVSRFISSHYEAMLDYLAKLVKYFRKDTQIDYHFLVSTPDGNVSEVSASDKDQLIKALRTQDDIFIKTGSTLSYKKD